LITAERWPYLLTPAIPVAIVLELTGVSDVAVFCASAAAVIPPAALMGKATQELAARSGPGISGFMNVTFGNFPELIIAFFALTKGLQEVVKATIIGSIVGNALLVLGAAMVAGGLRAEHRRGGQQRFERQAVAAYSAMLL